MSWFANLLSLLMTASLILPVRLYQVTIKMILPGVCRFHPSCSEYFILAVKKHGPIKGGCMGVWRVCRCHPWNAGGYDPP